MTILRNIPIPLFIKIESGAMKRLQQIMNEHHLHFTKPLIITEEQILRLGGNDVVQALGDPATILVKDNSLAQAQELAAEIKTKGNDLLVSVGGGRVLDVGKYAASAAHINYISVPTSPSNDGICSPVAVLKNADGVTESLGVSMPVGILVDPQILVSAPLDNIRAGVGDLISNFSAIADWKLAYAEGKDKMDDFAATLAYSAAQLIFGGGNSPRVSPFQHSSRVPELAASPFSARGGYASGGQGTSPCDLKSPRLDMNEINLQDENFLVTLTRGLILSGIAMNVAGSSRPCSGAEHEISHAIDKLYPRKSLHGLQVAWGTLFANFLRGENIAALYNYFNKVGLPTKPAELGLTTSELVATIDYAPQTRPDRYTILEKLNLSPEQIAKKIPEYEKMIDQIKLN